MIKSNEGQTTVDKSAKQLRAHQLEEALNLTDKRMDALMKTHELYCVALANESELFGPRVQVALEDRSAAIMGLLAADEARQQIEW